MDMGLGQAQAHHPTRSRITTRRTPPDLGLVGWWAITLQLDEDEDENENYHEAEGRVFKDNDSTVGRDPVSPDVAS